MLRAVLAAFAALAMSACSYGSAIDVAPFKDRTEKAILADGDYCELAMKEKPYQVNVGEDCIRLRFDAASRTYTLSETKKPKEGNEADSEEPEEMVAAVVPLGGGLFAAQIDVSAEDQAKDNVKDVHQLNVFAASGNAFATLPVLEDDKLIALAKKQKRLKFGDMPPDKSPEESGDIFRKRPWIAEGSIGDIKIFLRAAAQEGVRSMTKEDWEDFSVGIRDSQQAAPHAASPAQVKDAEAVRKIVQRLK